MTNEGEIRRFEKLSLRIDTDKTTDAVATSEEAIYVLNLLKRQDLKINSAATEAIDMAISALEKQEPMKPLPQEMDIDGRAITPCGFCGEELPHNSLYDFCPYCGQAIDRRKDG